MVVLTLLGVGWLALERGEQGRRQGEVVELWAVVYKGCGD